LAILKPKATRQCSLLLSAIFLLVRAVLAGAGEDASRARERNRALKQELELAKSPALYCIIDLPGRQIQLKSRGMVLQEWKIERFHRWGDAPPMSAVSLGKKSTLFPPKRTKIKPGAEEEGDSFELDALELKDMPASFVLYFDGGVRISIRPKPVKFISRIGGIGRFFSWYLWVPLRNLGNELRGRPFSAFDLALPNKEETKALYWAMADGTRGLILL
jgi:hypothetical protein